MRKRYHLFIEKSTVKVTERGKRKDSFQDKLHAYLIDSKNPPSESDDGYVHLNKQNCDLHNFLGDIKFIADSLENGTNIGVNFNAPYNQEVLFGIPFNVKNDGNYFELLSLLSNIITSNKKFTIDEFEYFVSYFKSSVQFDITTCEAEEPNSDNDITIMNSHIVGLNSYRNIYDLHDKTKFIQFHYTCNNITDIIIAILHFISKYNYSFFKCPICQRYTLTPIKQGYLRKYCNRVGEHKLNEYLKNPNTYTCYDAVDTMMDNIRKKRRNICDGLLAYEDIQNSFINDFDNCKDQFKKTNDRDYLIQLYKKVNTDAKDNWYKLRKK